MCVGELCVCMLKTHYGSLQSLLTCSLEEPDLAVQNHFLLT